MKKFTLSVIAALAMSTFAVAGGDIAPVEPEVNVPEVVATPGSFYVGAGYSYFDASYDSTDVTAHGMLGLLGYQFNDYFAVEGRYTGTLSDLDVDGMGDLDKLITNKALYLKAIYPMGSVGIYGLIGYGETVANNTSDSGFQYGVGGSYSFTENMGLFVDWTRLYDDTGLNYVGDTGDYTIDTLNVGVTYKF